MTAAPSNIVACQPASAPVTSIPRGSVLADPERARMNMKAAEFFAQSDLIPVHYRGKPANCFIAINRAQALGVDEMFFMEKTYVVGGKLGLNAELFIELANNSGRFRGPMQFRLFGEGEGRGCTAHAALSGSGEQVENTVTYAMAKADGWTKNPKWQSLRDQMLQYRAGVFLGRLYAAGAAGGMSTREELEDVLASRRMPADAPSELGAGLAAPVSPEAKAISPPAPRKAPLLISLPHGWEPVRFERTRKGLKEALEFLASAVLDRAPEVVALNVGLLDTIAEKLPELAGEVSELRAAAAEALAGDTEPGALDPEELDEFGLPPLDRPDPEVLPTDPRDQAPLGAMP
jgi:hypothetical protein